MPVLAQCLNRTSLAAGMMQLTNAAEEKPDADEVIGHKGRGNARNPLWFQPVLRL
jgi:hypothetical protein